MHCNPRQRRALALGARLVSCSLSPVTLGTVSEYTTYASWTGIPGTSIVGVETFNGFSLGYAASPAGGTAGSVAWNAAATGGLYFNQVAGSPVLSTNNANTDITLSFLAVGGVSGVAGSFFATDNSFNFLAGDITILVTLNDSSTQSFTRTIASAGDFWGFHTTVSGIASLTISTTGTFAGEPFVTVEDLVFMAGASGPAIPLPGAAGLAAAGLLGLSRRRRR